MSDDPYAPALDYGDAAVALPVAQVLDDSVTNTPAVPSSTEIRPCPDGSQPIEHWQFVPYIPSIMRAQSPPWEMGAALMDRWFSGSARQLRGDPRLGKATDGGLLEIDNTITMDWVLQFSRARNVYDRLISLNNLGHFNVMTSIVRVAKAEFDQSGTNSTSFGVSQPSDDRVRDSMRCDSESVGDYETDPLDDLLAALGNFTINVIPGGTATQTSMKSPGQAPQSPDDARTDITLTQVSVYVRDSYDFNGNQPLGVWQRPNNVRGTTLADLAPILPPPTVFCPNDEVRIGNLSFREWRDHTGFGQDFSVYSDLKIVTLATPLIIHSMGRAKIDSELGAEIPDPVSTE